jgi:hypothetical protein
LSTQSNIIEFILIEKRNLLEKNYDENVKKKEGVINILEEMNIRWSG